MGEWPDGKACPHPGCSWVGKNVKSHHNNLATHSDPPCPGDCLICEANAAAHKRLEASHG